MLQKYNANRSLYCVVLLSVAAMLAGCADQNPPIQGIAANTNVEPVKTTAPAPATDASVAAATAEPDLSTKTTAPEGFDKFLGIFTPYRITIQQGNFVSKEMADQVKVGMTREQVRFLLGTALITDMFHADRWDYIFRLLKPSGEMTTSRVTVFFEKSLVAKIERGELPNEQDYLKRITDAAIKNGIEHVDRTGDKPKPKKDDHE